MDKLKWIDSTGGPLILISDKSYKLWSGVLKRDSYLKNKFEEADNFMDPGETDYGKACKVEDYLGVVDIGKDFALIFGDEPMLTTVLNTRDNQILAVRRVYSESEIFVDRILKEFDSTIIKNWQLSLTFNLSSDRQYLFDSASEYSAVENNSEAYLSLNILQGEYNIWTSVYEPDEKTQLIIHKFKPAN